MSPNDYERQLMAQRIAAYLGCNKTLDHVTFEALVYLKTIDE